MCCSNSLKPIKEQFKNLHLSILKLIIFFVTECILMTTSIFFGIIGADTTSSISLVAMTLLIVFFPIAKNKET